MQNMIYLTLHQSGKCTTSLPITSRSLNTQTNGSFFAPDPQITAFLRYLSSIYILFLKERDG